MIKHAFIVFFLLNGFISVAQLPMIFWVEPENKLQSEFKLEVENALKDSGDFNLPLNLLRNNGHLTARIETSSDTIKIYPGDLFVWKNLSGGNIQKAALNKVNFIEKSFKNKPVNWSKIETLKNSFLNYYENNGYPFAEISVDTIHIEEHQFSGNWHVQLNQFITIDSINILSQEPLPRSYIENYIGIKKGNVYNERLINAISTRVKEIPFANMVQPPDVIFYNKKTILNLTLAKQKASSFNGIVGFLPNETTGEILFTGDVKLALQNSLNQGEIIKLNWRKLQTNTQDLNASVNYPFAFNSPLGTNFDLKLYRRDTTFAEQTLNLGLQYALKQGNFFRVFIENYSTNLISTQLYENFITLPPIADVRKRSYGLGITTNKLNYRFNPRSGYQFSLNAAAGTRQILENINLNPIVYDSLTLRSNQFNFNGKVEYFFPVFKRSTIKIGNETKWLINDNIFSNELFRIGGFTSLRGFDEESITASGFTIFSAEYRILLEENSFFYLFTDWAYWERKVISGFDKDTPLGFGTGISFQTKAGIFAINYAIGRQRNNPIDIRTAKIHFGFLSLF